MREREREIAVYEEKPVQSGKGSEEWAEVGGQLVTRSHGAVAGSALAKGLACTCRMAAFVILLVSSYH